MSDISKDPVYEDFLEMTRSELEDFLAPRNLSCNGSKRELVARAFTAWELKLPVKISYEELQTKLRVEYERRLTVHGIQDPKTYPENAWKKDVSQWPLLDLGKLFEYILENREFGNDYIGKYKTQKAFSYYKSGFVSPIESAVNSHHDDIIIFRAKVTPSQSVRDQPRELWIALKSTGKPVTAWCSCTAGYGQTCNHIIAVLYKVEHAIASDYHKPACTEISSKWNDQTQKQVMPKKIKDMDIRKDSRLKESSAEEREAKRKSKLHFDPRRAGEDMVKPEAMGMFLTSLSEKSPKSVIFTGLSYQIGSQLERQLPPSLIEVAEQVAARRKTETDADVTKMFFESVEATHDQINNIEEASRGQSVSEFWNTQRKGRITASMCHTIYTKVKSIVRNPTKKQKVSPLVSQIVFGGPSLDHIEAVKWGREHEKDAREDFVRTTSPRHANFSVKTCGLIVHKDFPYIAASPDGIVLCECCEKAVVEFKCPFKIKGKNVNESFKETDFLGESDGEIHLKTSHKYFTQIQCQMAVSKATRCFFCVWTGQGMPFVEIIKFDGSFWNEVEQDLVLFYKNYVVKVLLGIRTIYYCPECQKLCLDDGEIEKDEENVVCCDKCDLWFHWGCVGFIEEMAASNFICRACTQGLERLLWQYI